MNGNHIKQLLRGRELTQRYDTVVCPQEELKLLNSVKPENLPIMPCVPE